MKLLPKWLSILILLVAAALLVVDMLAEMGFVGTVITLLCLLVPILVGWAILSLAFRALGGRNNGNTN